MEKIEKIRRPPRAAEAAGAVLGVQLLERCRGHSRCTRHQLCSSEGRHEGHGEGLVHYRNTKKDLGVSAPSRSRRSQGRDDGDGEGERVFSGADGPVESRVWGSNGCSEG